MRCPKHYVYVYWHKFIVGCVLKHCLSGWSSLNLLWLQLSQVSLSCQLSRYLRSSVRWDRLERAQHAMMTTPSLPTKNIVEAFIPLKHVLLLSPQPPWHPQLLSLQVSLPRSLKCCFVVVWALLKKKPLLPWLMSALRSLASCKAHQQATKGEIVGDWWVDLGGH